MPKKNQPTTEEMGWLWVHAGSAGGLSIGVWEVLRHAMQGPLLFVVYGSLTAVSLWTVKWHHNRKMRKPRKVRRRLPR